jgi:hypothetical protein
VKAAANVALVPVVAALLGCVGMLLAAGGSAPRASAYAWRAMVQSNPATRNPGNWNVGVLWEVPSDPVQGIKNQMAVPGNLVLGTPPTKPGRLEVLQPYVAEAAKHPSRFKWVYLYDEMFWEGSVGGMHIDIGAHEQEIDSAARAVHAMGLKTIVTVLPDVAFDKNFRLAEPGAFDVIALDEYPSSRLADTAPCTFSANATVNRLHCAVERLRRAGYRGEIWYVYQAFVNRADAKLDEHLREQLEAIRVAPSLGIVGLVGFGYDVEFPAEPRLAQGKGTEYEALISCAAGC